MKEIKKFLVKNWLPLFCFLIIFLQFSQIVYFKRAMFSHEFNVSHWKDRFDHSQWVLPVSQRPIGDDGIYSYAAYRIINGESIEATNANKPPVGLYIIGLSIAVFNNPLISELLVGIGTIICFFFLTLKLLKDKKLAFMITCLFSLEPVITSNYSIALLDLPQLFFLILHLLFLLYSTSSKKYKYLLALISGVFLGFFAETKPPLFLPIIIPLELAYLYVQKQFTQFIFIAIGLVSSVLAPYFRYFQHDHNLFDYLKLHKYMASIYYSGTNQLFPLSIWDSLLIGYFPDVVTGQLRRITSWWLLLPFISVLGILQIVKSLFKKEDSIFLKGLGIFSLAVLSVYTIVPSYPRYLVLVIPFLYIFTALLCKKYIAKPIFIFIFILISISGLLYSSYLLTPTPDIMLQDFKYNFSKLYFQDVYQESITKANQRSLSEKEFRYSTQGALISAGIREIKFKEIYRSIPFMGSVGKVKYLVSYITQDLGMFSEEKTVQIIKENDQWKVDWNWNLLINSFTPGNLFVINLIPGKRGTIYKSNGDLLAFDTNSILISINPEKIDTKREQEMLKLLKSITFQKDYLLQNAYLENPLPDTYIPIATPFVSLNNKQQMQLSTFRGLKVNPYVSRIYTIGNDSLTIRNTKLNEFSTRIYSVSNYHGITGTERKYDNKLSGQNGGSLLMIDRSGNTIRTLINQESKNGKDIILP